MFYLSLSYTLSSQYYIWDQNNHELHFFLLQNNTDGLQYAVYKDTHDDIDPRNKLHHAITVTESVQYRPPVSQGQVLPLMDTAGQSDHAWGPRRGVLMSHVDFKQYVCRPVEFKKCSCRPVEVKKLPCPMPLSFHISCGMSLRPKIPHVALSILGV